MDDLVAELIQIHAASALRSYLGNLAFATSVAQGGWLPTADDSTVQEHLATLRRHLSEIGRPEDDYYLLRLGLTVSGTQRGIVPPLMVLDANRGGFSVRRQREAEGIITRLREALAIGRRFVPDLSPDTQQAVAELADLAQRRSSPSDSDWLGWFEALTSDQAEQSNT